MILIFIFIRQFRHDHQKAVTQSCISKVVQTYYILYTCNYKKKTKTKRQTKGQMQRWLSPI